LAILKTCLDMA